MNLRKNMKRKRTSKILPAALLSGNLASAVVAQAQNARAPSLALPNVNGTSLFRSAEQACANGKADLMGETLGG